jgi:hypothetical protein
MFALLLLGGPKDPKLRGRAPAACFRIPGGNRFQFIHPVVLPIGEWVVRIFQRIGRYCSPVLWAGLGGRFQNQTFSFQPDFHILMLRTSIMLPELSGSRSNLKLLGPGIDVVLWRAR